MAVRKLNRGDVLHYPGDRRDLCVVTTAPRPHGEVVFLRPDDPDWPALGGVPDYIDFYGWTDSNGDAPMVPCGMRLSERHTDMIERLMTEATEAYCDDPR